MAKWTPKIVAATVLQGIAESYIAKIPLDDSDAFIHGLFKTMFADELISGDELIVGLRAPTLTPKERPLPTVIAGMFIAAAFCVQAIKAHEAGQADEAWSFACDAQYWFGIVRGTMAEINDDGERGFSARVTSFRATKIVEGRWGKNSTYAKAKTYIQSEWKAHCEEYKNNKSDFARTYSKLVLNQFGVKVTDKTIREVWLSDTPDAGIRAGLPASG